MKIKLLSIIIASAVAVSFSCGLFNTSAYANEVTDLLENEYIEEAKADDYTLLLDEFSKTSEYAGAYFENGVFYISSTNVMESQEYLNWLQQDYQYPEVIFEEVKYNFDTLSEIRDKASFMDHLGVKASYTDPKNNAVVVEILKGYDPIKVTNELSFSNLTYVFVDDFEIEDESTFIRGGYAINNITSSVGYSCGCGIKWTSTGDIGFLTAAHSTTNTGDVFKYNGTQFGTVSQWQNSGSIDAALINRTDTSFKPSNKYGASGNICTLYGAPIVGDTVTLYGKNNTSSSSIIAIDYTVAGFSYLIKSSCISTPGDSGGTMISTRSTGNVLVGIHKGRVTDTTYTVASRFDKIKNQFGINYAYVVES